MIEGSKFDVENHQIMMRFAVLRDEKTFSIEDTY